MPSLEAPPLPATRFTIRSGLLLIQRPPRSFLLHSLAGGRGRNFVQHLTAPANEWAFGAAIVRSISIYTASASYPPPSGVVAATPILIIWVTSCVHGPKMYAIPRNLTLLRKLVNFITLMVIFCFSPLAPALRVSLVGGW